jgi:hypothetical protein
MSRLLSLSLKALCLVLAVPIIVYLGLRLYGPIKGAYWRAFRTPALIHDWRVEDLVAARGTEQRTRLLEVWRTGQGTYGLRQTRSSVEGTPIGFTLVAERGKATLILDYTRDAYGPRKFIVQPVQAIESVPPGPPPGVEAPGKPRGFAEMRLRCLIDSTEPTWF